MKNENKFLRPILASLGAIALILSGSILLKNKTGTQEDTVDSVSSGGDDKVVAADAPQSQLSVSANRCRGCGKCVRADAEHFALDVENRVAIVISTDNLDSADLQQAVNVCQENAIVIS